MPELLIIPGSLREASSSRAIARDLAERFGDRASCTIADVGRLPHYNADVIGDPDVAAFVAEVAAADGVLLITPEYNYSIPGFLKNAIDWASRPAFASAFTGKPCIIVSVSGGALGGVRAQAHLKYILMGMLARPHPCKEIVITNANKKVENGKLTDETALAFAEVEIGLFLDSLA